jgi:predicted alpha/beta-fold hydrolase
MDAMDGSDYAYSLDQQKKLGGAGTSAGSVTLAQYLGSHDASGTAEVEVFVCAPDTDRTTNGEPLPFNSTT